MIAYYSLLFAFISLLMWWTTKGPTGIIAFAKSLVVTQEHVWSHRHHLPSIPPRSKWNSSPPHCHIARQGAATCVLVRVGGLPDTDQWRRSPCAVPPDIARSRGCRNCRATDNSAHATPWSSS